MTNRTYYAPQGGLPPQTALLTDRAVFTESYAVTPKGVLRDITVSYFPFWEKTRAWVLSRPLSGFAETFSQYIMDVKPEGGSDKPEPDPHAEGVLFVVEGELNLTLSGKSHVMQPGGYAYVPPGAKWSLRNKGAKSVKFHWIRGHQGQKVVRTRIETPGTTIAFHALESKAQTKGLRYDEKQVTVTGGVRKVRRGAVADRLSWYA